MLKEYLDAYRAERKAFIMGLNYYFGINYYQLDVDERKNWLFSYLKNKEEFYQNLREQLKEDLKESKYFYNSKKE